MLNPQELPNNLDHNDIFEKLNTKFQTFFFINMLEEIKEFINIEKYLFIYEEVLNLLKSRYNKVKYNKFGNFSKKKKELKTLPDKKDLQEIHKKIDEVELWNCTNNLCYCAMRSLQDAGFHYADIVYTNSTVHWNDAYDKRTSAENINNSIIIKKQNEYRTLLHELLQIQENTLKSEYISNSKSFCWKSELSILHDKLEENEWKDNHDILRKTNNKVTLYTPGLLTKAITTNTLEELLNLDNWLLTNILENLMT